ncbi:Ig-like domain-containing protein [Mycobacterium sp. NPDC050853]|uniref:Ig-like domain-containing protein n=1 Tax=Mycobacterium sp. NPDC050853 TaxID=3155160 RepID=UPI00340F4BC8
MSINFQLGQSDLELAGCDSRVLLAPYVGTPPLTSLEDTTAGGIDLAKIGAGSRYATVGNYEKKAGVKLSNKPNISDVMSAGKGSPTRQLPTDAKKGITYTPQEMKLINLMNAWGFLPDAVSAPSAKGGVTIGIPELPANILWRAVLLAWDSFNGKDIWMYWICNKANVGDRDDINAHEDGNVITHGVGLNFQSDPIVGLPVIFGMCGEGFKDLMAATDTGGLYPPITGITVTPATANLTVTAGANHTKQLVVLDSNGLDRTAMATFNSDAIAKATVDALGKITAVSAGSANVAASYGGFTATCAAAVS